MAELSNKIDEPREFVTPEQLETQKKLYESCGITVESVLANIAITRDNMVIYIYGEDSHLSYRVPKEECIYLNSSDPIDKLAARFAEIQASNVLIVAGSGDIPLLLASCDGCENVDVFDYSAPACFFSELKVAAMRTLSYSDYMEMFYIEGDFRMLFNRNCGHYDELKGQLSEPARAYFDQCLQPGYEIFLNSYIEDSSAQILDDEADYSCEIDTSLFRIYRSNIRAYSRVPHLNDESAYNELQEKVRKVSYRFMPVCFGSDVIDIGDYDYSFISNINWGFADQIKDIRQMQELGASRIGFTVLGAGDMFSSRSFAEAFSREDLPYDIELVESADGQGQDIVVNMKEEGYEVIITPVAFDNNHNSGYFEAGVESICKANNVPEKVANLKMFAEAGINVPKHRVHITAGQLLMLNWSEMDSLHSLYDYLIEKARGSDEGATGFIVRSAHPMEGEFSGGAFDSIPLNIDSSATYRDFITEIMDAREEIVRKAWPQNNLTIRRDLNFNQIEGYDPNDMGIFINEFCEGDLFTITPYDDGCVQIGYVNKGYDLNQALGSRKIDCNNWSEDVARITNSDVREKLLVIMESVSKIFAVNGMNYELELIKLVGDTVCVQAKEVVSEETKPYEIDSDLFKKGVRDYFLSEAWGNKKFEVEMGASCSQVRECEVIVVDEKAWADEIGINPKKALMEDFKKLAEYIQNKWRQLFNDAGNMPLYLCYLKNISISGFGLADLYEQVVNNASVVVRGYSDNQIGSNISHHVKFGVGGLKQITVMHREQSVVEGNSMPKSIKTRLNWKTGDKVLVMVKKEKFGSLRASLLKLDD